ncbi:hypothetical protein BDK51DRAFT_28758 [Blyttiomyces helicus]|uniref:Uncharacterized protein n=1 Tax=Blyttiomyces helicus TaxID=388810 RepID=A0A4P9WJB6_9FUNG|nr:hypothetical protein BDK51DRAFT_28758 [Blyttiomyces helicus]|eukprot:RKO93011.1 hypothetical protein BDK51DRAFT_28758 [Blyttiomyces helicus]
MGGIGLSSRLTVDYSARKAFLATKSGQPEGWIFPRPNPASLAVEMYKKSGLTALPREEINPNKSTPPKTTPRRGARSYSRSDPHPLLRRADPLDPPLPRRQIRGVATNMPASSTSASTVAYGGPPKGPPRPPVRQFYVRSVQFNVLLDWRRWWGGRWVVGGGKQTWCFGRRGLPQWSCRTRRLMDRVESEDAARREKIRVRTFWTKVAPGGQVPDASDWPISGWSRQARLTIIEAKNLFPEKSRHCDTFCSVSIESGEELRTPTVYNESSPFFGEELVFEENLPSELRRLTVTVWQDSAAGVAGWEKPIGRVSFPKEFLVEQLLEEEQVRIGVRMEQDDSDKRFRKFIVTIFEAKNLCTPVSGGKRDPYIVCHLLPDPEATTSQRTQCIKETLNPTYNETLTFLVTENHPNQELHVSVWDAMHSNAFVGQFTISLDSMEPGSAIEPRWRGLLPMPARVIKARASKAEKRRTGDVDMDMSALSRAKQLVRSIQSGSQDADPARTKRAHKLIDTKFTAISFCGHCAGVMPVQKTHYQCSICCHVPCAKLTTNNCGSVVPHYRVAFGGPLGTLRLRIKYSESAVLPLENYLPFLDLVAQHQFRLAHLFGKVSKDREEAAMCFIKLTEAQAKTQPFLFALITAEIEETSDPNTLFRANSMASKALEVYMKHLGSKYLVKTLGDIIKQIVSKKVHVEVVEDALTCSLILRDWKKWKMSKKRERLLTNGIKKYWTLFWRRAARYHREPQTNNRPQNQVINKFPKDDFVRYTSVGGFIFLRFFAPAIFGPKLFGLIDEYVEPKTARTLTLLAKTLQSLANLAPFGHKEPYMMALNPFIEENIERMKGYIDLLAVKESVVPKEAALHHVHYEVAREAARLFHFYVRASPLIIQSMAARDAFLIRNLTRAVARLTIETTEMSGDHSSPLSFPSSWLNVFRKISLKRSYASVLDLRSKFMFFAGSGVTSDMNLAELPISQKSSRLDLSDGAQGDREGSTASLSKSLSGREKSSSDIREGSTASLSKSASGREKSSSDIRGPQSRNASIEAINERSNVLMEVKDSTQSTTSPSRASDNTSLYKSVATSEMAELYAGIPRPPPIPLPASPSTSERAGAGMYSFPGNRRSTIADLDNALARLAASLGSIAQAQLRPEASESQEATGSLTPTGRTPSSKGQVLPEAESASPKTSSPTVSASGSPSVMKRTLERSPGPPPKTPPPSSPLESRSQGRAESPLTPPSSRVDSPQNVDSKSSTPTQATRPGRGRGRGRGGGRNLPGAVPSPDIMAMLANAKDNALGIVDAGLVSRGTCHSCTKPVIGDGFVELGGLLWHQDHFVCAVCLNLLTVNDAYMYKGLPHCAADLAIIKAKVIHSSLCALCICGLRGTVNPTLLIFGPLDAGARMPTLWTADYGGDGRHSSWKRLPPKLLRFPLCRRDYYKRAELMCGMCGDFIEKEYITVAGRKYHVGCKRCKLCDETMALKTYFTIGEDIYCTVHQGEILTCGGCSRVITDNSGKILRSLTSGRPFHMQCFACDSCGQQLSNTQFYEKEDRLKCENCFLASYM